MSASTIQPDARERAAALRVVVLRQAEHHERQARELRAHAFILAGIAGDDPVDRWTSIHVDELVPGDRIISGGVEADVVQTGWIGPQMRLVVVDLPGVHGGTYPHRMEWAADAGVQVRQDLHERLVAELAAAEPEHEMAGGF